MVYDRQVTIVRRSHKLTYNKQGPHRLHDFISNFCPTAGAFCLLILILAQLVILAAGVSDKLQDDDQMAITLVDFREYQEQYGVALALSSPVGSGKRRR